MLPGLWWDGGDPPLDIDFVLGVHGGFSQHVKVDGRQTWGVSSTLKMSEPSCTSSSDRCFSTSCRIGLVWQSIRHHLFRPLQSCPYMSMLFMMCYTHAHWPYFFLIAHPVPGVSRPQAWASLGNRATSPSRLGRQPDMFPASPHCDQLPPFSHLFRGKSGISLSGRTGSNLPLCLKTWLQTVSGWVSFTLEWLRLRETSSNSCQSTNTTGQQKSSWIAKQSCSGHRPEALEPPAANWVEPFVSKTSVEMAYSFPNGRG